MPKSALLHRIPLPHTSPIYNPKFTQSNHHCQKFSLCKHTPKPVNNCHFSRKERSKKIVKKIIFFGGGELAWEGRWNDLWQSCFSQRDQCPQHVWLEMIWYHFDSIFFFLQKSILWLNGTVTKRHPVTKRQHDQKIKQAKKSIGYKAAKEFLQREGRRRAE
jgi:hypothetical protein